MSKRVVIGKIGTSSGEFGLRVSKAGTDAINSNGTAVNVDNLIFDSKNPTGSLALYKVFDITVNAGSGGNSNQGRTPTEVTQAFGETLSFTPFALVNKIISSSQHYTEYFTRTTLVNHNAGDSNGPDDDGFVYVTSTSNIIIKNYGASQITVRAALFYAPV